MMEVSERNKEPSDGEGGGRGEKNQVISDGRW